MTTILPSPPAPVFREFDQVVKGNVDIKQLCNKHKYKITFSEIGEFLRYQVLSDSSQQLNDNRTVYYQKAKKWVQDFKKLNESLKASNKPLFTPTTVMEIGNKKYLFVIHEAKLNRKRHIVFNVSTEEIKLSEKKMLKLPCGDHNGVRFDIDYMNDTWCFAFPNDSSCKPEQPYTPPVCVRGNALTLQLYEAGYQSDFGKLNDNSQCTLNTYFAGITRNIPLPLSNADISDLKLITQITIVYAGSNGGGKSLVVPVSFAYSTSNMINFTFQLSSWSDFTGAIADWKASNVYIEYENPMSSLFLLSGNLTWC